MSTWTRNPLPVAIALSAPLFIGACAGLGDPAVREDIRIDQLLSGMEQCLANQADMTEQLRQQSDQLQQQRQQLAALQQPDDRVISEPGEASCPPVALGSDKLVVGELEQVRLQEVELSLTARIDTGAETSSLDARNIELFERNSRRWVRFEILHPETGEPISLERRLKRVVVILQSNTEEPERRPVIKLGITLGHISQTAEFTLSNRSHLDYQILIGRNVLKDYMVVDVSERNIAPLDSTPAGVPAGEDR